MGRHPVGCTLEEWEQLTEEQKKERNRIYMRNYRREWREKNREIYNANQNKYYHENKENCLKAQTKYTKKVRAVYLANLAQQSAGITSS